AFKTVAKQSKLAREVAKKTLKAAEIQKIPGNSGDALKVIQTLPGVARSAFGAGPPIIRGSSPEDTKAYIGGHLMPLLFHFGGLYSVINTDLIEDLDYWPGGFSARYGHAIGGLINVSLREPKLDRWHGVIESNLYHVSLLLEGPLGEHTGLAIALRRSYIDLLFSAIVPEDAFGVIVAPRYYDYQVRFTHDFSPTNRLGLFWYGSDDELRFVFDEPMGQGGAIGGTIGTKLSFHLLTGTWDLELERGLDLKTSLRAGYTGGDIAIGDLLSIDVDSVPVDLRTDLDWEVSDALTLTFGAQMGLWYFDLDFFGPPPPKEGKPPVDFDPADNTRLKLDGFVGYGAVYAEASFRLFDRLTVIPGLRLDGFGYLDSGYVSVDPRLAVRVDIAEGTTAKAYMGLYHQPPQFDEWSDTIGNPALGPERCFQISVGAEQRFTEYLNVDVQAFYKWMDQLVTPVNIITEGVPYENRGVGRVYGLEIMAKHDMSEYFFGWLSYSLMRAERRDGPEAPWRLFDFDQSHILTLVGVFRLGAGWEAGFRFRYATGNPQTPVVGAVYDSDTDSYVPMLGAINTTRIGDFHQLDLRVDKKFVFDGWMLDIYLELINAYFHGNPEGINYNYDYSESEVITGIPFLPNIGVRAEF
ncbi:MAG: TonB-dependent receptor, partial [Myxococcota bacterium]|nr:TonB-dependent receptor [Myxococcota bacterium]